MKIEEYKGKKCPYNNKVEMFSVSCKMCSVDGKCHGPKDKASIVIAANLSSIIESVFDINRYTNRFVSMIIGTREIDIYIFKSISKEGATHSWNVNVDDEEELKRCCAELSLAKDSFIEEKMQKENNPFDELLENIEKDIYMVAIDNSNILKKEGAELFLRGNKDLNGDQIAEILCALEAKGIIK